MAIKKFQPETALIGTASIGLVPRNIGSNDIWHGYVNVVEHGEIPAYIKRVKPNEIYIEIFSAVLGRALGVPIPRPILVYVANNHPDIVVTGGNNYFFGSEDVEMPTFERLVHDKSVLEEAILAHPDMYKALTFDELIANPDRNNSNILYNGQDFRFIDHEKCLNSQQNPNLAVDELNKIASISDIVKYYQGSNDIKNEKLMRLVRSFVKNNVLKSDLDMLAPCCMASKINTSHEENRIKSFLSLRMKSLIDLVDESIRDGKGKQQDLLKVGGL